VSCQVVIGDPTVSRRHAEIRVDGTRVTVVDLGSRNGLFVNDKKIEAPCSVESGDVVYVGDHEFQVLVTTQPRVYPEEDTLTSARRPRTTNSPDEEEPASTQTFDDLELIGRVTLRALRAGHIAEAESMIESHLHSILRSAEQGSSISGLTIQRLVGIALDLAEATHRQVWFDQAARLLLATRAVCTEELHRKLTTALGAVPGADVTVLNRYASALRTDAPSMESIRASRRVDDLVRAAALKGR
jgi:pSer/pThr/pTyr-binding forkhead associated (FHA) protein